jgi:hypothetical protein
MDGFQGSPVVEPVRRKMPEERSMARFARVIAVGVPHPITQRGNVRRFILQDEADRYFQPPGKAVILNSLLACGKQREK